MQSLARPEYKQCLPSVGAGQCLLDAKLIIVFPHILAVRSLAAFLGLLHLIDHLDEFRLGQGLLLAVETTDGVQIVVGAGGLWLQVNGLKLKSGCGLGSRLGEGDTGSRAKVGHLGLMLYAVYS